jgi:hypothetical protein
MRTGSVRLRESSRQSAYTTAVLNGPRFGKFVGLIVAVVRLSVPVAVALAKRATARTQAAAAATHRA